MKKLLLVIDYQYDFAAADGKLSAGPAALAIEPHIAALIEEYRKNDNLILFTLDDHTELDWASGAHPESAVFEPHCVAGTPGYELYGRVGALARPGETIAKRAYCPEIEHSPLGAALTQVGEVTLVGLVTDICVFQSAIGLYTHTVNNELPVKLAVDSRGCASFNAEREQWALQYLKDVLGLEIR